MRRSRTARRSSSSRLASSRANDSYARSARAGPRQSSSASCSDSALPSCESCSKRARSSSSVLDADQVAGCPRDDPVGPERLPKLRDVVLDRVQRLLRRAHPPELVDQAVRRDDLVGTGEQQGEQRPLTLTAEWKRAVAVDHLQGAKDPEFHLSARSQRPLSPPAHLRTVSTDQPAKEEACPFVSTPGSPPSPPLRWPWARAASYASAGDSKGKRIEIPANLANLREPGSTGYVPKTTLVTIPAGLQNLREPGSTGYVPTQVTIPAWLENFQRAGLHAGWRPGRRLRLADRLA